MEQHQPLQCLATGGVASARLGQDSLTVAVGLEEADKRSKDVNIILEQWIRCREGAAMAYTYINARWCSQGAFHCCRCQGTYGLRSCLAYC